MFKTRIKRSELLFNIIVLALFAVTASIQLLSAYGAVCLTYNIPTGRPSPPFPAGETWWMATTRMETFAGVYIPMNILTWILAFAWGFLVYAYFTKMPWKRFFLISIIVSALGFISGVIPGIISDTDGFTEAFEMGSPHWGRAIANALMLVIILAMNYVPKLNIATKKFIEERNVVGQYAKQLIIMSLFFFWLGAASFLGTSFMASAHVIDGTNVWQTIEIQFIGGVITSLIGTSMLSTALIYSRIRPSSALITTK